MHATLTSDGDIHAAVCDEGRGRQAGAESGRGRGSVLAGELVDALVLDRRQDGTTATLRHRLSRLARLLTADQITAGTTSPARPDTPALMLILEQPHTTDFRIRLDGPIDVTTAPQLHTELARATRGGSRSLTVDLGDPSSQHRRRRAAPGGRAQHQPHPAVALRPARQHRPAAPPGSAARQHRPAHPDPGRLGSRWSRRSRVSGGCQLPLGPTLISRPDRVTVIS